MKNELEILGEEKYSVFDPATKEVMILYGDSIKNDPTIEYNQFLGTIRLRRFIPLNKCIMGRIVVERYSMSEGQPIKVTYNFTTDQFIIIDGNHRFVEALERGDEYIDAWITGDGEVSVEGWIHEHKIDLIVTCAITLIGLGGYYFLTKR